MAITYHAGRRIQGLTQDTSLDGTNDGCTTGVTGKLGNAWSFDGSNDKVTLTPTFSGKSAFTYSAWINPSSSSNHWGFPFYEGSGENPKVGIGIDYYNSNGLAYFYVSTASHSAISISASNIPKGSWTHVTGVYDGSASSSDRLKFYINGSLVSSTLSGTPPTTIPTLGGDLYLGWYQANYWFNGLMDQTLFYDKALSASEISTIYNSGSGTTTPDTVGLFAHYNFEQTGNTLVNQVTAGDVKPTDVQVGSRYEETDTRKMYHYNEDANITTDGSDTIITFKGNGTFTPTSAFNVEYLVIGGGGGGGSGGYSGGGGAGAYRTNFGGTAIGVTAQSYSITVGSGGSGTLGDVLTGGVGASSIFSTITSVGGGGGGSASYQAGASGGNASGGGGSVGNGSGGSGGSYGNNGGSGYSWSSPYLTGGGGGGGSGAVGSNGVSGAGGAGGAGTSSSITGSAVIRAGGGGGLAGANNSSNVAGAGGTGGGGAGGTMSTTPRVRGTVGTSNTGSGGGAGYQWNGGKGGSGIVILRFSTSGNTYTIGNTWKEEGT